MNKLFLIETLEFREASRKLMELVEFANKYYWSKDINEYLSHHPKPKVLIKCKKNINICIDKIKELKQKYPLSVFTLYISDKENKNILLPQEVSVINKITSELKKESIDARKKPEIYYIYEVIFMFFFAIVYCIIPL